MKICVQDKIESVEDNFDIVVCQNKGITQFYTCDTIVQSVLLNTIALLGYNTYLYDICENNVELKFNTNEELNNLLNMLKCKIL